MSRINISSPMSHEEEENFPPMDYTKDFLAG